ncbi:MAG: SCP2 sterol-binding domain-containing protein [Acidimicrobiia bacterium]
MADEQASLDELRTAISGKSDDEINATMTEQGVEGVLAKIFDVMAVRFQPDRAAGQSAVIGWDITAPDGVHRYQLKVEGGTCTPVAGGDDPARVTLAMALPDFLRFLTGELEGMSAFMTGKLKLTGDMMFAQAMQAWFSQ